MTTKKPVPVEAQVLVQEALSSPIVADLIASGGWRNRKFVAPQSNPDETAKRIAQRDLMAGSLDELLGGVETISGKDYVNRPFTLLSVEWQPSEIAGDGLPFYVVMHIADENGEHKTLTTGAVTVCRKVAIMDMRGWLPARVKIVKGPKTPTGYEPMDLAKADLEAF